MSKKFLYVNANGNYEETVNAFESADFINTSAGVADAAKPVVLDAAGLLSNTMINQAVIDHDALLNFTQAEHRIINDAGTALTELWSASKIDTEVDRLDNLLDVSKSSTGFENRTDSVISFVDATRTFTIDVLAPATSYDIYASNGAGKIEKTTISTSKSVVIADIDGPHFIYFDGNTLISSTTFNPEIVEGPFVYVAIIWWNTVTEIGFLGEERHGLVLDGVTHRYLHRTVGTAYDQGLNLTGYTLATDSDAAVSVGISDGIVWDEDIDINIVHSAAPANPFEQILTDPAQIPVLHKVGAAGLWTMDTATNFAFKNTASGRVNYNNSGTWGQTEATDGYFVDVWLFATNLIDAPIVAVQGQAEYATQNIASSSSADAISGIIASGLPSQEYKLIWRMIVETDDTFTVGARKAKIVEVTDFRSSTSGGTSVLSGATDHGGLSGLTDPDHPASAITVSTALFNGILSASDTLVQTALDTIDDHTHDDRYYTETELDAGQLDNRYYTETELNAGQLDNIYFQENEFINVSAGAADAGKPIITDAGGLIDGSFIDSSDVDHGQLAGLGDDDHTQYILVDGSRAFTGIQSYNSHPSFVSDFQLVDKKYVDDKTDGLEHQDSVLSRVTAPAGGETTGDRYLVIATATGAFAGQENKIAEYNGATWDFFAPSTGWEVSVDDETDGKYLYGGSSWTKKFYEVTTASLGVKKVGVDIQADLLASGGLALTGNQIGVNAQDFDGEGLIANTALDLALDWSTLFNDSKPVKASDLSALTNGLGASILGIEDAGGYTSATNVEAAIQELYAVNATPSNSFTSAGVTIGDLVYFSADNTVDTMPISASYRCIGIAVATAASGPVLVAKDQSILAGLLTGAVAGTRYYWTGSALSTTIPSGSGSHVWIAGIAVNATDLFVDVKYVKKNA